MVTLTDAFCRDHLNDEYRDLARAMTAALCRKRPSQLASGQPRTWACGIIHILGRLNFLPHYDRFVSLMPRLFVPLMVLLHSLGGEPTSLYFADATKLAVCHNRRIHRHKVFDGLAARGKTSMGWFFGLKLHFVVNHKGQVMALK